MPAASRILVLLDAAEGYARKVVRGVADHARLHDMGTSLRSPSVPNRSALRDFGAIGVITALNTPETLQAVRRLRLPVVNVSTWLTDVPVASVCPDNVRIGKLAAEFLLERGFRHVAFFGGGNKQYVTVRREAFAAALKEAGVDLWEVPPIGFSSRWRQEIRRQIGQLRKTPKPLAVFTANDEDGRHFLEVCRRGEFRVPDEIAVLGVDNDEMICEISTPTLSSVDTRPERIGYEAAAMMMRLLEGEPTPDEAMLIPPAGVIERRSTEVIPVADAEVATAMHYIREHADEPMRVADVVTFVGLSRRTLERRFTQAVGRSPAQEIRCQHIKRAQQLLSFTDWNLTRIAYASGFRSFRHLAEVFRRELDESPTTYRKRTKR